MRVHPMQFFAWTPVNSQIELKDAEQQQQRSGREVEDLQTQLSAALADAWPIRMVERYNIHVTCRVTYAGVFG